MSGDLYVLVRRPLPGEILDALADHGAPWYARVHVSITPFADVASRFAPAVLAAHDPPCQLLHLEYPARAGELAFEYATTLHGVLGGYLGGPDGIGMYVDGAPSLDAVLLLQRLVEGDLRCMADAEQHGSLRGSAWIAGTRALPAEIRDAIEAMDIEVDEVPFRPWSGRAIQDHPRARIGTTSVIRLSPTGARDAAKKAAAKPSVLAEYGLDDLDDPTQRSDNDPLLAEVARLLAMSLDGFALAGNKLFPRDSARSARLEGGLLSSLRALLGEARSPREAEPPRVAPPIPAAPSSPAPVVTAPVIISPAAAPSAAPAVVVPQRFRIEAASHTDVGPQRNHNEDDYALSPDLGLYLVTDGMGGHHSGDRVARMTIAEMLVFFAESHTSPAKPSPFAPYPERSHEENRLAGAVRAANHGIHEAARVRPELVGSGTTVAAVAVTGDRIQLAHVGDCRIYRLRGGAVSQLTRDHTLYADVIERFPDMSPEDRASIPRNVVVRAIGMNDDVLVDTRTEPLMAGDIYLLATDGACQSLEPHEIAAVLLSQPALDLAVQEIIDDALARDGNDNATAILIRIGARLPAGS